MPTWLVEDPTAVYLLLGTLALALVGIWWTQRKRKYVYGLAGVLLLIGVVGLLDFWVVSDREEVLNTLQAMARRVEAVDVDGSFDFLSEQFSFHGATKERFRQAIRDNVRRFEVRETRVWDLEVLEASRKNRTARVTFQAKVRGNFRASDAFYLIEADFILEEDDRWRMSNFEVFNPLVDTKQPAVIPGLP